MSRRSVKSGYNSGYAVRTASHLYMSLLLSINVFIATALLSITTSAAMSPHLFDTSSPFPLSQALLLCSDAVNRPLAWLQILLLNRHKSSQEREGPAGWCAALLKELFSPRAWWKDAREHQRKIPTQNEEHCRMNRLP